MGALLRADADRATAEGGSCGSRARARVGGGAVARVGGRRRGERGRPRSVRRRTGERAGRGPPGAPRHGLRARSGQPVRPARGQDRRARGRRLGSRERDDARCGQRHWRGCGTGRGGRPDHRARPARAPLHRLGGTGPRRGQGARRVGRERATASQPRRDERRRADDRLSRERPHASQDRAAPGTNALRSRRASRRGLGRQGRSFRWGHRPGPRQRDQSARARARLGAGSARPDRRRREPQRAPALSARGRRGGRRSRGGLAIRSGERTRHDRPRVHRYRRRARPHGGARRARSVRVGRDDAARARSAERDPVRSRSR